MDIGTTISGLVLTFICVLPIIIISRSSAKKKQFFMQAINKLASQGNDIITATDIWGSAAIGFAADTHKVFFYTKSADYEVAKTVNLNEMRACRIVNISSASGSKESQSRVIDRLELALVSRTPGMPETVLEFYNTERNKYTLTRELQLTDKWAGIINAAIKKTAPKK